MSTEVEKLIERRYPFIVSPDPDDGDWLIIYPDLPGCMTHTESIDEIGPVAHNALVSWIEVAVEFGDPVPEPGEGSPRFPDWALPAFPDQKPSLTSRDVARRLGVTPRRVLALAKSRGIGERYGRSVMFRESDIARLTPGQPGRPATR